MTPKFVEITPAVARVASIDRAKGTISLEFLRGVPTEGGMGRVEHDYALETAHLGELVVESALTDRYAVAHAAGNLQLDGVKRGDRVTFARANVKAPRREAVAKPVADQVAVSPKAVEPARLKTIAASVNSSRRQASTVEPTRVPTKKAAAPRTRIRLIAGQQPLTTTEPASKEMVVSDDGSTTVWVDDAGR